jgi:intraflagellar transport protein 52
LVLFNACKREQYHPNSGYKKLFRRLRATYKVSANKDDLSPDRLDEANLMVFGGPRERFTEHEIQQLKMFVKKGGSALFLVGEGGDDALGTNINAVVEEFGMAVRQDSVVRTVYYKYLYPKEVFIANGVLQPAIAANKNINTKVSKSAGSSAQAPIDTSNNGGLNFVFPHGATMNVEKPAVVRPASVSACTRMERREGKRRRTPDSRVFARAFFCVW